MFRLFGDLAQRYDLHTPPHHYQHDHAFVLEQGATLGSPCRLLDVGCGTGVLVEKALRAGLLARGIDASAEMIRVAEARVGRDAVAVRRMQEIAEEGAYDLVVALSWTLNYCEGRADLVEVLRRVRRALRPGGRFLAQVAHAEHVDGEMMEDREVGPTGEAGDVVFRYRFVRVEGEDWPMRAEYRYACASAGEVLEEEHMLRMADARQVARCVQEAGLGEIEVYDSWRRDSFKESASPFLSAVRAASAP